MKKLIKKCLTTVNLSKVGEIKDEFGTTNVYGLKTDDLELKVWNSSNRNSFNHQDALKIIVSDFLLEDDECVAGHFMLGFNEIMFEIDEI